MSRLTFTAPDGQRLDFDTGSDRVRLRRVLGAGVPDVRHQTIRSPLQDGQQYGGRSRFEPRFLEVEVVTSPLCSYAEAHDARRKIISVLNPQLRSDPLDPLEPELGELRWSPDDRRDFYIDAILESGVSFEGRDIADGFWRELTLEFRCPDPAWRPKNRDQASFQTGAAGLSVPISVPISLAGGGGTTTVTNEGDLQTFPRITMTGSFSAPRIFNDSLGRSVDFPGLSVSTGQEFVIDMNARTAEVDGSSVMQFRTAESEMWPLMPGDNDLRVTLTAGSGTVVVEWFRRFLGV
ncbi:MAG: phage distal tail protein [Myxococcota bacterium]